MKQILQETDDGCLVWEIEGDRFDKIDFFSSIFLAEQAYPTATNGPMPPRIQLESTDT